MSADVKEDNQPYDEINITPMLDLAYVLLVIFIIMTTASVQGVKVELPKSTLPEKPESKNTPPITLAVTQEGNMFWNDQPISLGQLESRLSVEAQKVPQPSVNVRGDRTTKYRTVAEVVRIAQAQGMRKVGFVAENERN